MQSENEITYLDLFAGAGGLSEGFAEAGYQPIAHVEMDHDACDTLKTRESYYYLKSKNRINFYREYLKNKISKDQFYAEIPNEILSSVICETMSDESMPSIFERIDDSMHKRGAKKIDLILGGPPCQAYSVIGRARKCMDEDPRNHLYELYLQAVKKYAPSMFVFENVPGLYSAGNGKYLEAITRGFEDLGYELEHHEVNASDYGVLQNRHRIILIGWKTGTNHFYPNFEKFGGGYHVSDLLEDLPSLEPGKSATEYKLDDINIYLRASGIRDTSDVLTWHVTRANIDRDREIYRKVIKTWKDNGKRLKYSELPDNLKTHKNETDFQDRYKVVAGDLPASQTMVAHISKDGHYFIHPDIEQARSLSVREAARIQSFPDNFFFEGSRTAAYRQIGNAVPPLLAKTIAIALKPQFEVKDEKYGND